MILADGAAGEMRYRLLETLRRLRNRATHTGGAGSLGAATRRVFTTLTEQAEPHLHSPERYRWMERLDPKLDNFRAALAFSLGAGADPALGMRLSAALTDFWQHSGHTGEGREWLHRLLDRTDGPGRTATRAKAIGAAGLLAPARQDQAGQISLLEESVALWRTAP